MREVGAMVAAVEGGIGIGRLGMLGIRPERLRLSSLRMGIVSEIGFEVGMMIRMRVGVGIVEGGTGTVGAVTRGVRAIWVRLTLVACVAVQRLTSLALFYEGNEGRQ